MSLPGGSSADVQQATERDSDEYVGVTKYGKGFGWTAQYTDRIAGRVACVHARERHECAKKFRDAKRAEAERFEIEVLRRHAADPSLNGLERAPSDASKAARSNVYWHVEKRNGYRPFRVIVERSGAKSYYRRACEKCAKKAKKPAGTGGVARFCERHGGGRLIVQLFYQAVDTVDAIEALPLHDE